MLLPEPGPELAAEAMKIADICRASLPSRAAKYRIQKAYAENGRAEGVSLCNYLFHHIDRLGSHLFSPSELRFMIDFENHYPTNMTEMGDMAARVLTREWQRKDIDRTFGSGLTPSLVYGSALLKQRWDKRRGLTAGLVMPWQFGVYREDVADLDEQEAMCEVSYITVPEAMRMVMHLPNAKKLIARIAALAQPGGDGGGYAPTNFMQSIISSSVLNTSGTPGPTINGGVVDLAAMATSGQNPEVRADLLPIYELYVYDDELRDYCTIQIIPPDILIFPYLKRMNLHPAKIHPYTLIQPNTVEGYFWGRSELTDLIEPQRMLDDGLYDVKRLMAMQFDKLIAFTGMDGMPDEQYATFRAGGYVALPPGAGATDLTPKLPEGSFQYLTLVGKLLDQIAGFDNILSGQGEQGVRAGVHADTLIRTASPRLRDRALTVERQCADAADKTLDLLTRYDANVYRTNPENGEPAQFLLHNLPDDRRVCVDSHSSSPIYEQDYKELVAFGIKAGFVDGEAAIDLLRLPMGDTLKARIREAKLEKAKLIQEHPEILTHGKKK
jgi:hypothetical protein